MSKHSQGSLSLRAVLGVRLFAWLWVRAELRAERAKDRYRNAYAVRYGEQFRDADWWVA